MLLNRARLRCSHCWSKTLRRSITHSRASSLVEVRKEPKVADHLKHKDRVDMVRTPGIASEVAGGKRKRNADEIRRLSRRFKVSPEVFF